MGEGRAANCARAASMTETVPSVLALLTTITPSGAGIQRGNRVEQLGKVVSTVERGDDNEKLLPPAQTQNFWSFMGPNFAPRSPAP